MGDEQLVLDAFELFDEPPRPEWIATFLASSGHHLLLAFTEPDQVAAGFISGVETTHPDKGTEMFVYELGVAEANRRRGIATLLLGALEQIARANGCFGMWVATEPDNEAAIATYRSVGSTHPEPTVVMTWTFDDSDR